MRPVLIFATLAITSAYGMLTIESTTPALVATIAFLLFTGLTIETLAADHNGPWGRFRRLS